MKMKDMSRQGFTTLATGYTFRIVSALVIGIVVLFQGWEYAYKPELRWSNGICLLAGLTGAGLLYGAAYLLCRKNRSKKHRYMVMGAMSLAVAFLTFYSAGHYALTPGWDVGMMCENAQILMWGGEEELSSGYFSTYPNNILLTWLLAMSYRLSDALGIPGGQRYFLGLGVQSLGFGLAAYLVYICSDKIIGRKHPEIPLWSWFVTVIMVCASPWVAVMYSDAAALILIMIEVWLYTEAREHTRFAAIWYFFLFFTGIIAYYIKPQAVIFLIAAAFISLTGAAKQICRREGSWKRIITITLACLAGAGLAYTAQRFVQKDAGFELDSDRSFGPAHYLMMGLNEEESGTYFEEDVNFSVSFGKRAERNRADLERAAERIRAMGIGGLARHAIRKTLVNYSDGTFTWEKEGIFYAYDTYYFPLGFRWGYEHIPNFYIGEEFTDMVEWSCSWVFRLIEQCAWMAVLFLCVFAFSKKSDSRSATVFLALLGMFLFGLLFEARARYVFEYVPVYILAAGMGAGVVSDLIKRICGERKPGRA